MGGRLLLGDGTALLTVIPIMSNLTIDLAELDGWRLRGRR